MKKNILANIFGKFWSIFSIFLFVPLYIKILGFESFSLISFTLVIAGMMAFLDGGLTSTLSREMARADISLQNKITTFKTLETLYIFVVIFIILLLTLSSGHVSANWLKFKGMNESQISYYLKIVSVDIAFQLYFRFNLGALLGLEKQVKANIIQVGWGMSRNGLVLLAILYRPTLEVFFLWQAFSTFLFCIIIKLIIQKTLNLDNKTCWKLTLNKLVIKTNWKFAGGMLLISLVAGLNTQIDKFIIGKTISLQDLGYYTLSVSLCMGIVSIISPISVALLPRFTALFSGNKKDEALVLFNSINLIVSIIAFALMTNLIIFSKEVLWIWTGDLFLAEKAMIFLPFMAISYTMLSLVLIPYNIAIANGNTKINNVMGLLSLLVTIPGYWFMSKIYGPIGVVIVFCAVQTTFTFLYYIMVNKKFLKTNITLMFLKSIISPLIIASLTTFALSFLKVINYENRFVGLLWIGFSVTVTFLIPVILLVKHPILEKIRRKLNPFVINS